MEASSDKCTITNAAQAKALLAAAAEQLGREISVTISRAVLNENNDATYSLHVQEEPDSFYVFTEEDYARELASRKSVSHFKTKKIRDAEAAARRARVTKAIIRVQFPDNYILQVTFQPSDTLVSLTELLKKVISRTDLPFSLYITPPKVHLCDLTKDFYELGLCPGGLVHFVYDIPEGNSWLLLQSDYLVNSLSFLGCLMLSSNNSG
ncbi:hypothetical protein KP509_1Z166400 [Ceratopteris richardii]|nr:hypothetical protein KP509_1Z166400 [Ceratopteris richardii]